MYADSSLNPTIFREQKLYLLTKLTRGKQRIEI